MESSITIDDLPQEMKLFILSFFQRDELSTTASRLSKNWRRLCCDPSIWRRLVFFEKRGSPSDIIRVLNRNQFVRDVIIIINHDLSWLDRVTERNSVLSIKVLFCTLSKSIVSRLIHVFPRVHKLDLRGVESINVDAFEEITKWPLLTSVKLATMFYENSEKIVSLLATRIKELKQLDLRYCSFTLENSEFQVLLEHRGSNLTHLQMNFSKINEDCYQQMAVRCINLKYLNVSFSQTLTDSILLMMLKVLPSLEILSLEYIISYCSSSTVSTIFLSLFENAKFPRLKELTINKILHFNDAMLQTLVKCCPQLRILTIENMDQISNKTLKSLPNICCNLEGLNLHEMRGVTERCIQEIANQTLQMRYCKLVNDECKYTAVNKRLPALQ